MSRWRRGRGGVRPVQIGVSIIACHGSSDSAPLVPETDSEAVVSGSLAVDGGLLA